MDSPQSVVSPFKGSKIYADMEKHNSDFFPQNPGCYSKGIEVRTKESIGELEVYVHKARDIHNICIYHKQDVYAKICLTSDPEITVATKTINGGGQNPVFDDKIRIKVQSFDCSLKCEIWMLSRVRNYLEDQLLGFALVPLSEVLVKNGNIEKEFTLSSTDLFHSPAGFVQLSLSYTGSSPDVIAIPSITDIDEEKKALDFGKMEFPDPKIANENDIMVSEYFGYPSQSSESFVSSETENQIDTEIGARFIVESFSNEENGTNHSPKHDSDQNSSVSTNGYSKSLPNQESVSPLKEKEREEEGDAESNVSVDTTFVKPIINVGIEPEQNVVQQDYVDMYMKSMQQFTDSLAKMKLPIDIGSGPPSTESSSSDTKTPTPKNGGARVFYGSRAFF